MTEPTYGTPPGRAGERPNGAAVTAVVTGVVALVLSWIPAVNLIAFVLALVAVVVGVIGMRRSRTPGVDGRGKAITGVVTGSLALAVGVLVYVGLASFIADNPEVRQELQELESELPTPG